MVGGKITFNKKTGHVSTDYVQQKVSASTVYKGKVVTQLLVL